MLVFWDVGTFGLKRAYTYGMSIPSKFLIGGIFLAGIAIAPAVTLFETDTFASNTTQGWTNGNGGTGITLGTGGVGGAADPFLRVEGFGSTGSPNRLASYNESPRYTGDYLAAGATGFTASIKNFSSQQLSIRLVIFDGLAGMWTSTNAQIIAANADWSSRFFEFSPTGLTSVTGDGNFNAAMANVTRVMFRHQTGAPGFQGTIVTAAAGFDNIQVVPEPATVSALGLGIAALVRKKRARG